MRGNRRLGTMMMSWPSIRNLRQVKPPARKTLRSSMIQIDHLGPGGVDLDVVFF